MYILYRKFNGKNAHDLKIQKSGFYLHNEKVTISQVISHDYISPPVDSLSSWSSVSQQDGYLCN